MALLKTAIKAAGTAIKKSGQEVAGTGIETMIQKFGPQLTDQGKNAAKVIQSKTDLSTIGRLNPEQGQEFIGALNSGNAIAPMQVLDNAKRNHLELDRQNKVIEATQTGNSLEPQRLEQPVSKKIEGPKARKANQKSLNVGRTKEEGRDFGIRQKEQETIGSHHHVDDLEFIGDALNRTDDAEIKAEINALRSGTVFGDRKAGLIGAMDQKTFDFRTSAREDIAKQIEGFENLTKTEQQRLLNDLQKEAKDSGDVELVKGMRDRLGNVTEPEIGVIDKSKLDYATPTDPDSYGLPRGEKTFRGTGPKARQKGWKIADTWPDGRKVTSADKRSAYHSRLNRLNIDRKQIKYDPTKAILSKDHIDIIHYAGYNSPEFTAKRKIEALMESGEWLSVPPREAAKMIVDVMDIHRHIVMNVSLERLRMIKDIIKRKNTRAGKLTAKGKLILSSPQNIRQWTEENLQAAANVGWNKPIPTFKELSTPPKIGEKELLELQTVFATELSSIPEKILQ
tara:strand:+ start:931 stop:2457 length:1527 start_codon:yes stop_codon:yes gene_type:complete